MSEAPFEGEKLTITKVEIVLLLALVLVVATFFLLGVGGLVVLGVVLTAVALVLMTLLASGRTPSLFDHDKHDS